MLNEGEGLIRYFWLTFPVLDQFAVFAELLLQVEGVSVVAIHEFFEQFGEFGGESWLG